MTTKGRQWEQKKTHCPIGHPYDEANTFHWRTRRICKACARGQAIARIQ